MKKLLALAGVSVALTAAAPPADPGAASQLYVRHDDYGLQLISADLSSKKTLVPGYLYVGTFDTRYELLWTISNDGKLVVQDLRDPAAKPVVIVDDMPQTTFVIKEPDGDAVRGRTPSQSQLELTWSASPAIAAAANPEGDPNESDGLPSELESAKKAKLVGGDWLKKQLSRKARALPDTAKLGSGPKVDVGENCDSKAGHCGKSVVFGKTGMLLVVTDSDSEGVLCSLYDPKTKKFHELTRPDWSEQGRERCDLVLDPSQTRWLEPELVCSTSGCTGLPSGSENLGWKDPGLAISLP